MNPPPSPIFDADFSLLKRLARLGALGFAALVVLLWVAFLGWGRTLPVDTWAQIIHGFERGETILGPSPAGHVPRVVAVWLVLLTLVSAALLFPAFVRKLAAPVWDVPTRTVSFLSWAAVSWITFESMLTRGYHGETYNVQDMMTNPGAVPIFGQRRLLVWPAMLLKDWIPSLSYIQAFLAAQFVAVMIATYLMGVWSAEFIGKDRKFVGQFLMALFLIPTFGPFVAHDMGILIFYTLCLLFLYRKQYALFIPTFAIGILNHQNILVLIPVCVAVMWGQETWKKILWVAGGTWAIYIGMLFLLDTVMPIPLTRESGFWWNMRMLVELRRPFIMGQLTVLPWFLFTALILRYADSFLKRASILLLMEVGSYSVYGQLNEARIFDGFIPVMVGIFLCFFRDKLAQPKPLVTAA